MSRVAVVYKPVEKIDPDLRKFVECLDREIGELDYLEGVKGKNIDDLYEINEYIGNVHHMGVLRKVLNGQSSCSNLLPVVSLILSSEDEVRVRFADLAAFHVEIGALKKFEIPDRLGISEIKIVRDFIESLERLHRAANHCKNGIIIS